MLTDDDKANILNYIDRIIIEVSNDVALIDALVAAGANKHDAEELIKTYRNL